MLLITDGITCGGEFESDSCCDITGVNLFQLLTFVCMHLKDTSNTLFFIFCCVQYVRTGVHGSGIYTEVCKLSYKRVSHDLKCQSGERLFIGRVSYYLIAIYVNTIDRRNVGRSRHVLQDSIEVSALPCFCMQFRSIQVLQYTRR